MSNASVVLFQVRRGRATSGQSRDVTEYVASHNVTGFTVTDGANPSAAVAALFDAAFDGSVLFIERCAEDSIPFLRAVAERLGHTVAAFAVAAAPRKRLPLVAVDDTEGEQGEDAAPMLANA
jgi:hypothetical protein